MNRIIVILLLVTIQSVNALTPQEIRDAVDTWLAARWPTVVSRETTYASNHNGNYWQGLITHTNIPADDIAALADLLDNHPTDQLVSWNQAIPGLPTQWPMALVMDVYDGPLGKGYCGTIYIYITQLGRLYSRSQNVGPETWRTQSWHALP